MARDVWALAGNRGVYFVIVAGQQYGDSWIQPAVGGVHTDFADGRVDAVLVTDSGVMAGSVMATS